MRNTIELRSHCLVIFEKAICLLSPLTFFRSVSAFGTQFCFLTTTRIYHLTMPADAQAREVMDKVVSILQGEAQSFLQHPKPDRINVSVGSFVLP